MINFPVEWCEKKIAIVNITVMRSINSVVSGRMSAIALGYYTLTLHD
jgi:hypothetical protein